MSNSKFEIVFKDGKTREVEAFNFSCAVVIAAHARYTDEKCRQHTQLFINEKKCRQSTPNTSHECTQHRPHSTKTTGLRKKFTENAEQFDALMVEMLQQNQNLKQAIKDLMPILRDWDPDHSSPEERNVIRKARELTKYKTNVICPVCKEIMDTWSHSEPEIPCQAAAMMGGEPRRRHAEKSPECAQHPDWFHGWHLEPIDS